MNPYAPIQPLGGGSPQSGYLAQALAALKQSGAGSAAPDQSGGIGGGLAEALMGAQAKTSADQASYAAQLKANGIDPTLDPGAGPMSLGDKLKAGLGGLFGLGASQM